MNRRQEERVADLGRAFQEAIGDIIRMGEEISEEISDGMETVMQAYEVEHRLTVPSAYPSLANHEINIRQVHNGFIVSAGCQTFVFEKFETASRYMTMYFQDPEGTENKHREGTLFK
jgi:hypothetical protein